MAADGLEFRIQVGIKAAALAYVHISFFDHLENGIIRHIVFKMGIAQVEKVRNLVVITAALARGRYHHHSSGRVGINDVLDFFKLSAGAQGGSSEFCYFQHLLLLYPGHEEGTGLSEF